MNNKVRTRIAPSPTGYPHIGTVFQALIDYVYAKKHDGAFVVRIEDTDRNRYVEDAEEAIFAAFDWFGLTPDESPRHDGAFGPYRQSERLELYKKYADQLIDQGDAYYCFCSPERLDQARKEMQKQDIPPMYDKCCRNLEVAEAKKRSDSEKHVVRMKVPENQTICFEDEMRGEIKIESRIVDDQVILKSDGFPTYHLAVVVDDHLMEISHIVRGEEWISSAPKHKLLYDYLGWEMPVLVHTPLLRNPDKSKLGKRHGHASVSWYIDHGYLKEAVINFMLTRVWNHPEDMEVFGIEEAIKHFDFKDMHIQGPIVDLDKLNWLNGQWIRTKLTKEELLERIMTYVPKTYSKEKVGELLPLIYERLVTLDEVEDLLSYFFTAPEVENKIILKQSKMSNSETSEYLTKVVDVLEAIDDWNIEELESRLRELQQIEEIKPRAAFMSIRVAITGRSATPPLFDVMKVLGKEEVVGRISQVKENLLN